MEHLIINKPEDPLTFLISLLKRENDDGESQWSMARDLATTRPTCLLDR